MKESKVNPKKENSEVRLTCTSVFMFPNGCVDVGTKTVHYHDVYEDAKAQKDKMREQNLKRRRKYKSEILFYANIEIEWL